MDLSDLRRLVITSLVAAGLLLLWGIFLALHDGGQFTWGMPETALGWFGLQAWMWVLLALAIIIVAVVGLLTFTINTAPTGYAQGKMRQVQCQDCKAVFFVHDSGHRPLTHQCPSCKALGVYDGKAPAVGKPPVAPEAPHTKRLGLTCHACEHRFRVTDTGKRPLQVTCPNCQSVGQIN